MPAKPEQKQKKTAREAPNYVKGGPPPAHIKDIKEIASYYGKPLVVVPPVVEPTVAENAQQE